MNKPTARFIVDEEGEVTDQKVPSDPIDDFRQMMDEFNDRYKPVMLIPTEQQQRERAHSVGHLTSKQQRNILSRHAVEQAKYAGKVGGVAFSLGLMCLALSKTPGSSWSDVSWLAGVFLILVGIFLVISALIVQFRSEA